MCVTQDGAISHHPSLKPPKGSNPFFLVFLNHPYMEDVLGNSTNNNANKHHQHTRQNKPPKRSKNISVHKVPHPKAYKDIDSSVRDP